MTENYRLAATSRYLCLRHSLRFAVSREQSQTFGLLRPHLSVFLRLLRTLAESRLRDQAASQSLSKSYT